MSWISGALGAVGSIAGGLIGAHNSNNIAAQNIAMQKEFAQNGIRWKVEDAKRAGIHPLFALGANTSSFTPVGGYSGDYGVSDALSSMGQSIDRAKQAKMTPAERAVEQAKADQAYDLDIRQKEANITATMAQASYYARLGQQQVPSMPGLENRVIEGQANALKSPGTVREIAKIGQWSELPNGNFVYMPSTDYLDFFSESPLASSAFQTMAVDSFRKGVLNPPYKAPFNKEWVPSGSGLTLRNKSSRKPIYAMDAYELLDFLKSKF